MSEEAIKLCDEKVCEGRIVKVYNKMKKKFSHENKHYYVVWVQKEGKEFPIMLSDAELNRSIKRAEKNTEDVPKKSLLTDMVD